MLDFLTTTERNDDGLLPRYLTLLGTVVCTALMMLDKQGNAVVVQLDTPKEHRGNGYAKEMLRLIGTRDTDKELRVISTVTALGYYRMLGYEEIAPHVFTTTY
jgi:histone acetyltransferase (RNA polymerase elongator complex component)